jgi:zinc protease
MLIAISALARADGVPASGPRERVPAVETLHLANGLAIVLAPEPTASTVVVHVRFAGGAADDAQTHPGDTALLERLLFLGSRHVRAGELDAAIEETGGWTSSASAVDHVAVVTQVPAGALERVLWLEAERIAGLADGISEQSVARARSEVLAAWRAAYADQPYGLVARAVQQALWPADHDNARLVLGDGRAVATATPARVRELVRARFVPERTTVVIAGGFEREAGRRLAERYFAWIPPRRGGAPARPGARPPVRSPGALGPRTSAVTESVWDATPRVVIGFRTDGPHTPASMALELAARVLAGGRTSRLWRRLVGGGLATEVSAELTAVAQGGELRVHAIARDGVAPSRLAAVMHEELAALRAHGVSGPELARAAASLDAERVFALESQPVRARALATWLAASGAADGLADERRRLRAVTADEVARAVRIYLAAEAAVTVLGIPEGS